MKTPVALLLLAVLCAIAFAPGLTSPLTHYDDPQYISSSALMTQTGWKGFAEVWNSDRTWQAKYIEFFPLRDSVYWVIFQRYGKLGTPYHVVTLFFHIMATWMMLFLLLQLRVSRWAALVATFLFSVHPIHIESVTWAAGLKDPMYTAFLLSSLSAWVQYRRSSRPGWYALSLLLLLGSLLVKSMAIVTPLLIICIDRWGPDGPTPARKLLPLLAGHTLLCIGFTMQFVLIGKANRILVGPHGGSQISHLVLSAWAQVVYLKQAFVPATFRLIYCFTPVSGLTDPRMLAALALLPLLGFALYRWRAFPVRLFAVAWYFVSLLPVSNIIPFPAIVADRYLYAASLGVCLLIALLLESTVPRLKTLLAVVMVATLMVVTAARTAVWQNEEDLWAEGDEDPACMQDWAFRATQVHLLRFNTTHSRKVAMASLERIRQSPAMKSGRFPNEAWVWNASMLLNLHRDLPLAAQGAEMAWKLDPTPLTLTLRGLTALEVDGSPTAQQWVLEAVRASPEATCPALGDWLPAVPQKLHDLVREPISICRARNGRW